MADLFKTTIVFEVLHKGVIMGALSLQDVVYETIHGHASGDVKSFDTVEVTPEQMASLLTEQRSDPQFFEDEE